MHMMVLSQPNYVHGTCICIAMQYLNCQQPLGQLTNKAHTTAGLSDNNTLTKECIYDTYLSLKYDTLSNHGTFTTSPAGE